MGEESGIGNYARQIAVATLDRPESLETTFFYGYPSKKLVAPLAARGASLLSGLRAWASRVNLARKAAKKFLRIANRVASAIRPVSWDCYFEPNFVFLPSLKAERNVLTAHDFSCFRFPQWHPAERARYMQKHFWKSVEKADRVIAISNAVASEATRLHGIDPAKLAVIPNGVDHALFRPARQAEIASLRQRYKLPERFVLYAGALEPRKNLVNLIKAHAQLPASLREAFPLALAGSKGWNNREILDLIKKSRHVSHLGYIAREDLPALYSAATIFAYPSWYEGFGLPPLEAMACGRAALISTDPALREVCAKGALCAEAGDVDQIANQMRRLLEDKPLREALERDAIGNAARYNWAESAKQHLDLLCALAS